MSLILPADGREHRLGTLRTHWLALHASRLRISAVPVGSVRAEDLPGGKVALFLRVPVLPGSLRIAVAGRQGQLALPVTLTPTDADSVGDGMPDWMRLHDEADRQAFRAWFTGLAERAADTASGDRPAEIVDCASLLRYAYREALRLHDDRWYAQFPAGKGVPLPDLRSVGQWSYPHTPMSTGLFRTRRGAFLASDLEDGTFSQFADAKTLLTANAFLVGRDLREAKSGDLIFYHQLEEDSLYHSMVITGEQGEWVIYHTGPGQHQRGEMRRVLIADLLHHSDARWRPEPSNPNFLGVYRWDLLRED